MSIFHRIQWEQWHMIFPIIAFFLIFSVFLLVVFRILRTPNANLDRLSSLPLETEKLSNESRTQSTR